MIGLSIEVTALLLTILVEFVIIYLVLKEDRWTVILLYVTLINCVSLPLAFRLYNTQLLGFYGTELFVFILEVFLLGMLVQREYGRVVLSLSLANFSTAVLSVMFL
ncbi:hypothetical protein CMI38_04875 [Candidatus Pacearchaeota archaeon]|nr:hypothetical protein [Candidatus Pacearchaeota archaeon]|tara:strand:+ start:5139 stop:5456 length:318 start_codon:yes stop_codon:yes gene_type:complete